MSNSNQAMDYNDPIQESEYLFSSRADDDDDEEEKIEKIEEALVEKSENDEGGDWGDVDPEGGEDPGMPGGAI